MSIVSYLRLLAPLPQFSVSDYAHYITQVANLQLGEVLPDGTTVTFIDPSTVAGHVSSQLPSIACPTATIFCLRLCTLHHASGQPSAGWGPPRWHHCHLRWPLCGSKTYKIYIICALPLISHSTATIFCLKIMHTTSRKWPAFSWMRCSQMAPLYWPLYGSRTCHWSATLIARSTATIFCLRLCTLHCASGQPSAGWGPPRWHHCHLHWPLCSGACTHPWPQHLGDPECHSNTDVSQHRACHPGAAYPGSSDGPSDLHGACCGCRWWCLGGSCGSLAHGQCHWGGPCGHQTPCGKGLILFIFFFFLLHFAPLLEFLNSLWVVIVVKH